jgi:photosystem II stability/assembly factor-like uncharacterized protein
MKQLLKISFLFLLFPFAVNAQWIQQISGTTATLRSVKAVDNDVVWAAGDNGIVLNTSDGGETWNIKTPTEASYTNFGISSFDKDTAIVIGTTLPSGTNAKIWKTTDSGNTWIEKYYSDDNFSNNIHFFDSNDGIYLGDPNPYNSARWNILTTTDGGNSWNRVPHSNYPPSDSACGEFGLVRSYGAYGDTVWFSTYYEYCPTKNNRIFRSTDKGYNWEVFNMPYQGYPAGWIAFSSSSYGVAISNPNSWVSRTTDGGETWAIIDTISNFTPWAVRNAPGYLNYFLTVGEDAAGMNGKSYYTNNSGNFWAALSAPSQSILLDVSVTLDSAWAVGNNGIILKSDIITEVEEEYLSSVPTGYALSQNYPNPFNPSTKIRYYIPQVSNVVIKVFDILGNEIETLVNEEKQTGTYELTWKTENLPSSVYFYRLQAGDFIQTRKMILMK